MSCLFEQDLRTNCGGEGEERQDPVSQEEGNSKTQAECLGLVKMVLPCSFRWKLGQKRLVILTEQG